MRGSFEEDKYSREVRNDQQQTMLKEPHDLLSRAEDPRKNLIPDKNKHSQTSFC
jgi:hypothetical protein